MQAISDNRLYLCGDSGSYGFDSADGKWKTIAAMPMTMVMPASVAFDGAIWVIGGEPIDDRRRNDRILLRYDFASDAWTDQSPDESP